MHESLLFVLLSVCFLHVLLHFLFVYTGGFAFVQCITQYFFDQYINAAKAVNFYPNHRRMVLLNFYGL